MNDHGVGPSAGWVSASATSSSGFVQVAALVLVVAFLALIVVLNANEPPAPMVVEHDGYRLTYLDYHRGYGLGARTLYEFSDGTTCLVVNGGRAGATDQVSCARADR